VVTDASTEGQEEAIYRFHVFTLPVVRCHDRREREEVKVDIEILGSGGAFVTPRPGCHCRVCDEAREKGVPYERRGPAYFVHGPDILFDTPEDISLSLNRAGVDRVRACFYSHYHPDHVMGRRVFEQLNWDVRGLESGEGDRSRVTDVYIPERVAQDFRKFLATAEHLSYLEHLGLIRQHIVPDGESVIIDGLSITPVRLAVEYVYAFLLEQGPSRTLIAPDELVGWTAPDFLHGIDLAIVPSGVCEFHPLSGERMIAADAPVLTSEMRYERTLEVIRQMSPKRAVLAHLDEPDGVSYDDGIEISRQLQARGVPVEFAWDGLRLTV
jgi:phosphoribosyl 1,2-cyclic phosphate phosphodiesterase